MKQTRVLLTSAALASACAAQADFRFLDLSAVGMSPDKIVSVGPDGLVVAVSKPTFTTPPRSFVWDASGEVTWIPYVFGEPYTRASGAAEDGSRVYFMDTDFLQPKPMQLWVWHRGETTLRPAHALSLLSSPWTDDTTRDGLNVVVRGYINTVGPRGMRITLNGEADLIEPNWQGSVGFAIGENGRRLIVASKTDLYRWRLESGLTPIEPIPDPSPANALVLVPMDCSGDTESIVGNGVSAEWLFDPATGWSTLERWNQIKTHLSERSMSSDGNRIVGSIGVVTTSTIGAVLHENGRVRMVQDILADNGIDMTNWFLTDGRAISGDGSWVAGIGFSPQGTQVAWCARLPTRCAADCTDATGERVLDVFDLLCFQKRFAEGHPYANMQRDDQLDMFDMLAFVSEFAGGCP